MVIDCVFTWNRFISFEFDLMLGNLSGHNLTDKLVDMVSDCLTTVLLYAKFTHGLVSRGSIFVGARVVNARFFVV
jgi:hypothetical protein